MWFALDCVVDHVGRNELIFTRAWKLTIHFHTGLVGVGAILLDDLLIDLFVGVLDRAGVYLLRIPKVPFGVEALKEIPLIAPRVGEREPIPIQYVFRKEARAHRPNGVGDTAGFIKDEHHAVVVMHPRIAVRVFLRPQFTLRRPIARPLLQVALDQFAHPFGRHQLGRADLPPMVVDRHRRPLGQFAPCHRPQLRFGVGGHNDRRTDPCC